MPSYLHGVYGYLQAASCDTSCRGRQCACASSPTRHHQMMFAMMVLARHQAEETQSLNPGDHSRIIAGDTQLDAVFDFGRVHCPAIIPCELRGMEPEPYGGAWQSFPYRQSPSWTTRSADLFPSRPHPTPVGPYPPDAPAGPPDRLETNPCRDRLPAHARLRTAPQKPLAPVRSASMLAAGAFLTMRRMIHSLAVIGVHRLRQCNGRAAC